jgi:hypothetical protein
MVRVICPVCFASLALDGIPERLPVEVPAHVNEAGTGCFGAGRLSRDAWMVKPLPARS